MNDERMSVDSSDGLTDELRALGAVLRAVSPDALDDAAVRLTFRAARAQARRAAERRAAAPAFVRRASAWASAAALVVSVATLAWVALTRDAPVSEAPHASATYEPVVFQPLLYAPSFSPDRSYRVVRVRIPLSALALGQSEEPGATIEADVLVGDDGLASGIRFDPEDTLLITASR